MTILKAGDVISQKNYEAELLALSEALKEGEAYGGVVTAQRLKNGSYVILSRYEDLIWELNPSHFPPATLENKRTINLSALPNEFVDVGRRYVAACLVKGLAGGTVREYFKHLSVFLRYLESVSVKTTSGITPLVAMQYVENCKSLKGCEGVRIKGQPLSKSTLQNRFLAVERLNDVLAGTPDQFVFPWPNSSAAYMAGNKLSGKVKKPQTAVIPEEVFIAIFQYANSYLERSEELLNLRDEVLGIREQYSDESKAKQIECINKYLKCMCYNGTSLRFNKEISLLESSCWLIIMATTGIRVHELGGLNAHGYHSKVEDGDTYYFIESKSLKTGEGEASWLCPKIAIDALKVMTRLTQHLRDKLTAQILEMEAEGTEVLADKLRRIQHSCMLTMVMRKNNSIGVLTDHAINEYRLKKLVKAAGVDWHFSSHQLRRTFAHFVIHNQLGDLRYLRDHFKHWSLDMTSLYALDGDLDLELFNEINFSYREKGQNILEHWMDNDTPLSGGLKGKVVALRKNSDLVKTYGGRDNMLRVMSDNIIIRSTGIAWCTNDAFGCGGGQCEDCGHGLIDDSQQYQWEAMYAQQLELRGVAEQVGPGGNAIIERTIRRCEAVLADLGADMGKIKERVVANAEKDRYL